jgi:hypothetical protein
MTSIGALTFHRDIDRSVLPEFVVEVNPSNVPYSVDLGVRHPNQNANVLSGAGTVASMTIDEVFSFLSRPENLQII